MPRKEGTKAKVGRKPPRHAAHTPRNSWTSPAKLARRKRINEASRRIVSKAIRSRLSPNK